MCDFDGWAPDDYDRNVNGGLAGMEKTLLAMDFKAHGFSWGRADKPHKFGWEVYDEVTGKSPFNITLEGRVRLFWDHTDLGHITEPGVLERMREYINSNPHVR